LEILNYLKKLVYKVLAENCPELSTTVLGQIQGRCTKGMEQNRVYKTLNLVYNKCS